MGEKKTYSRRQFIDTGSKAVVGLMASPAILKASSQDSVKGANDRIVTAAIGTNSRGHYLSGVFAQNSGSEVKYICDPDDRAAAKTKEALDKIQSKPVKTVRDFRSVLDDPDLDAVFIAAPDHWHTPAAILALQAGKHVLSLIHI